MTNITSNHHELERIDSGTASIWIKSEVLPLFETHKIHLCVASVQDLSMLNDKYTYDYQALGMPERTMARTIIDGGSVWFFMSEDIIQSRFAGLSAHEAVHAVDFLSEIIGFNDHETRGYMTQWLAQQIYDHYFDVVQFRNES